MLFGLVLLKYNLAGLNSAVLGVAALCDVDPALYFGTLKMFLIELEVLKGTTNKHHDLN